jgi:predicted transcriptional regulator
MTALARADQKMQQCLQSLIQARAAERAANIEVTKAQRELEHAHGTEEHDIANSHLRAAEHAASQAQNTYTLLRKRFDDESLEYEKLGGTVDYHNQLPN